MADEQAERERVVAIALQWERTPYRHEARIKGVAADCTFIAAVYEEAGLIPHVEIGPYSSQWHLHQREERYLGLVLQYAHEIEGPPQPGDVVLYKFGRVMSHSGIVIFPGWPHIIHAGYQERIVSRADGTAGMMALPQIKRRYFSVWGKP